MKHLFFFFALLLALQTTFAQKPHRIVYQFTNAVDSMQQKAVTNQLKNIISHWGEAVEVEVVLYNQGLEYAMSAKSRHQEAIRELMGKGVKFVVCENTLRQRKISKDEIMQGVGFVPAGIAEIVERQEQGWSYIKGGF